MKKFFIFIFTILFSTNLLSDVLKYNIKDNYTLNSISNNITWQRLLYIKNSKSEVITKNFFLTKDLITAKNELIATINAYDTINLNNFNDSPRCKFPARYFWLSKFISFPNYQIIDKRCTKLSSWKNLKDTTSISVMLVSGYLGNPASTFGHSFLKLNSKNSTNENELFDLSINYGALVPDKEPIIKYIFKGIFGGYEAGFSDKYFYTQDLVYSNTEFRDIWDYKLNLSEKQKKILLLHLWEIIGKKFKYYFLDKNCGYRVSQILELVLGKQIVNEDSDIWYIPVETFNFLEKENKKDNILESIKYVPSIQKKLFEHFKVLSLKEQTEIKKLINNKSTILDNKLNEENKINVLDFLIRYYKYKIIEESDNSKLIENKNQLLLKRLRLPTKKVVSTKIKHLTSPAKNNNPIVFSSGIAYNSDIKIYNKFNFSAFNIESIGKNNLKLDELIVGDLSVGYKINKSKLFLDSFDLIKIKKFKTSQIDFDEENLYSWKVQIGTKLYEQNTKEVYNTFFNGSIGKSYEINSIITGSLMLDANIQTQYPYINTVPNFNLHFDFNKLKSSAVFGYKVNPYNSNKSEYLNIQTQYNFNKNFAISTLIEKDKINKYSLNLKWFF